MNKIGLIAVSVVLALMLAASTVFIVDQRQVAVVYALGEIKEVITEPGLKVKLPPPFQNVGETVTPSRHTKVPSVRSSVAPTQNVPGNSVPRRVFSNELFTRAKSQPVPNAWQRRCASCAFCTLVQHMYPTP